MYQANPWMQTHTPGIEKANQGTNDSHTKIQYEGVGTSLMPETVKEKNEKHKELKQHPIDDTTHELTSNSVLKVLLTSFTLSFATAISKRIHFTAKYQLSSFPL
jgi:hypothetical protein